MTCQAWIVAAPATAASECRANALAPGGAPTGFAQIDVPARLAQCGASVGAARAANESCPIAFAPDGAPTAVQPSSCRINDPNPRSAGPTVPEQRSVAGAHRPLRWKARLLSVFALAASCTGGSTNAGAALPEQVERVKASVVAVGTFSPTRNPRFSFRGTGFAVGDGTLVATNAHVVPDTLKSEERETISIALRTIAGRAPEVRTATLAGLDRDHDLALLRISGSPLPALRIGDSSAIREGEAVAFTGFPIGSVLGLYPVTHRGIVSSVTPIVIPSATSRQLDEKIIRRVQSGAFEVFQLDATAYPGNSGSPVYLIDSDSVVGTINMVFVKGTKEAALTNPSGISFAIPSKYLNDLIREASSSPARNTRGASSGSTK